MVVDAEGGDGSEEGDHVQEPGGLGALGGEGQAREAGVQGAGQAEAPVWGGRGGNPCERLVGVAEGA